MGGVELEVVEVREGAGASRDARRVMREEGRRLLSVEVPAGTVRVALSVDGEMWSTQRFAEWLGRQAEADTPVAFYVGGAWGLSEELVASCPLRLSLSRLTLAHELCRVVLLEQLYRAATLLRGAPYHK